MLNVSKAEPISLLDPSLDLVRREIARVGAPADELAQARAFVLGADASDARAYDALSPRVRRLVDLVAIVEDHALAPVLAPREPIILGAADCAIGAAEAPAG